MRRSLPTAAVALVPVPVLVLALGLVLVLASAGLAQESREPPGTPPEAGAAPAPTAAPDSPPAKDSSPPRRGGGQSEAEKVAMIVGTPLWLGLAGLVLLAWQCLAVLLAPGFVERAREAAAGRPILPFFLGTANTAGLVVLGFGAAHIQGPGTLAAGALGISLLAALVTGLAAKAETFGATLLGPERGPGRLAPLAVGWGMMWLVGIVPIAGWIPLGYWALSGIGGVTLALLQPSRPRDAGPGAPSSPAATLR
ncbi:MAG: hypothetical protein L0216_19340 [Planctomycetales bacterium]|nr:hypothetical protein [Planctomycetales bacterium]